ncbi:MAG TPA: alpha-L-fucosidase [Bryocella sp.]|nr:alpha-L-fucosidase [Bryocella sp.]
MKLSRRTGLKLMGAGAASWFSRDLFAQQYTSGLPPLRAGSFAGTRASLRSYQIPKWFGEAKFGMWAHWGPQSAVGDGDWYARNMYIEGSPQYKYHQEHFGPQSKVGYKDLVHLFTADRWDPDALIDLYVKAGAKYFFSMGVHHDNFDLWNSKYQPRWNAVAKGPGKDVVGIWAAAARKRGLRFGVSEHLSNSYDWWVTSHLADKDGPHKGVPYDGNDPNFAELYHDYRDEPRDFLQTAKPMGRVAPDWWKLQYTKRVMDLIDQHQPDLLYTDGGIPFEEYGLEPVAELYNVSGSLHGGHVESIYTSKIESDCAVGTCVLDRERGVADGIRESPWQTDTCIGDWHYKRGIKYKSAKKVIDLLVDIVSKNGNLLLNFPLPASGELDSDERVVLAGITEWMQTNGTGIYGTKPWKAFGEGPALAVPAGTGMNENRKPDLTVEDFRFVSKGDELYVFAQGAPRQEIVVKSLGRNNTASGKAVKSVELLGSSGKLKFKQEDGALRVTPPNNLPASAAIGVALRLHLA